MAEKLEQLDHKRLERLSLRISSAPNANNSKRMMEKTQEEEIKLAREIRKEKYRADRKSRGLPSSDEEESLEFENKDIKTLAYVPKKKLPRELENSKNLKHRLNESAAKIRQQMHQAYVLENGSSSDLRQCEGYNCQDCEKHRKKPEEENVVIPKRLPYEIRKIKESKLRLNEEIQKERKEKSLRYHNSFSR